MTSYRQSKKNASHQRRSCRAWEYYQQRRQSVPQARTKVKGARKKERFSICAYHQGKLIANVAARRDRYKQKDNVCLGVAILKGFRGAGLGRILLSEIIKYTKKNIKCKNIYLTVYDNNTRAKKLYESRGFKEIAKLPNWINHFGKYQDEIIMILKK